MLAAEKSNGLAVRRTNKLKVVAIKTYTAFGYMLKKTDHEFIDNIYSNDGKND